jgi:(p)ppGpp synthase/HD superfamily hydrolase
MIQTKLIKRALYFAAEKHASQFRKGGHVPYIVHPMLVAFGVSTYTDDEEIIAAALLHDTIEDCTEVTEAVLQELFGERIAAFVAELSKSESDAIQTWVQKKEAYIEKIKNISKEAMLIVAVDKMVNMEGYFEALRRDTATATASFKGKPEEYLWYYAAVGDVIARVLGNSKVTQDYQALLHLYKK